MGWFFFPVDAARVDTFRLCAVHRAEPLFINNYYAEDLSEMMQTANVKYGIVDKIT
jgi:hypothetical protein